VYILEFVILSDKHDLSSFW